MRRYSRQELLRETGAEPEDLADLEARSVIVPDRRWLLFGKYVGPIEYYTDRQLEILRQRTKTRRTA